MGTWSLENPSSMTEASSLGVRLWARAAVEWARRHGMGVIDTHAFAATLMGLCPGWACVKYHLLTRNPGVALRDVQRRLDDCARVCVSQGTEDQSRSDELRLSPTLVKLWGSILTRYAPIVTDTAIVREWKLMRQHLDLWIGLLEAQDFTDILAASYFELKELPFSPHEPRLGAREMAAQLRDLRERVVGARKRSSDARVDALAVSFESDFNGLVECPDPELRRWVADSRRWSELAAVPVLTTAGFAATICYSTPLWYDYLYPLLLASGYSLEELRTELHACAEAYAIEEARAGTTGGPWTQSLATAWKQCCCRVCAAAETGRPAYEEWFRALCATQGSTFTRVLASCGRVDRLLRESLRRSASPAPGADYVSMISDIIAVLESFD